MGKVLKADCSAGDAYATKALSLAASWTVKFDVYIPTSTFTALDGGGDVRTAILGALGDIGFPLDGPYITKSGGGPFASSADWTTEWGLDASPFVPDVWLRSVAVSYDGSDNITFALAGTPFSTYSETGNGFSLDPLNNIYIGGCYSGGVVGEIYYFDNVQVFDGASALVFSDDFESGDLSAWDSTTGGVSVVDDPALGGGGGSPIPGLTIKIYDLGVTELADISAIALTRSWTRLLNQPSSFTITAPANSPLLTTIADDDFPNLYDGGNRKLVVWENADPDTDDPLFHGRIFQVERSGDANAAQVRLTAYDPRMELGYEADNRAGRIVRDNTTTLYGDPSFLTPVFSPTPSQDGISGPDLIKQILTYSQADPSTNPIQGEGPLPIDLVSGTWDLDVPPAIDMNPLDSADWPVLVGDFINQLIATDAVDFDLRPVRPGTGLNLDSDPDDYIMAEASSVSKMGIDLSATVHFDYLTGSHNAKAARQECDFSLHCDRVWYELGPRLSKRHWRGDITPHGAYSVAHGLLTLMDDSADKYGGPDTLKGYNASIRIFDSLGSENSSRPLYQALYEAEVRWRVEPRRLLYITPNPDAKALFQPPQDYDVYDLVQIKTGPGFGVELDEKQRIHGYTKTWTREGEGLVSELLTSADAA